MTALSSSIRTPTGSTGSIVLDNLLQLAARRIRIMRMVRFGGRALGWTAIPCALAVGISKLRWIETPSPILLASIMGAALLIAILYAATRRLSPLEVARLTERKTDLKERLSSAVEFHGLGTAGQPFYAEQLHDADEHAKQISLRTVFPIRMPWELPVGVLCALTVFLTYYLPTLPHFWSPEKKAEVAELKKRGIEIERVAKDATKAADQQKLDETKKAAAEARKLGEQMHRGKLTKKESLVALNQLTKKMQETQEKLAQQAPKKSLNEAHKEFEKSLEKLSKEKEEEERHAAEMQKPSGKQQARDLKKPDSKMDQAQKESSAMKQAREALKQMSDALANQDQQQMQKAMQKLAQQMQKGEMSKEEMKQMQQALSQLSQSLKDTNQQKAAEQMQQIAEAMQAGNSMDPKSLQQMADMMNKAGQQMGKGQKMDQMLDAKALGDLAKSLQGGGMTQLLGKGAGNGMGGKGPGRGFNGSGGPSVAMKDPGATSPKLIAMGKSQQPAGKSKTGSAEEFAKYLAMSAPHTGHLPNGKVAGTRSEGGNELHVSMTGDPQAAKSNSPYYQVVQTSKKQAESTLDKENIPASLKKQVKDYFDSIKP